MSRLFLLLQIPLSGAPRCNVAPCNHGDNAADVAVTAVTIHPSPLDLENDASRRNDSVPC